MARDRRPRARARARGAAPAREAHLTRRAARPRAQVAESPPARAPVGFNGPIALNSCIFAVHAPAAELPALRLRVELVGGLYAPLGAAAAETWWFEASGILVGRIAFGPAGGEVEPFCREREGGVLLAWGGPVPASLRSPQDVLAARPDDLRQLGTTVALIAADRERLVVCGGASGAVSVYAARAGDASAWATHAAAASLLARGRVDIDWEAVPELLAADSVGGTDTQLCGVRAFTNAWSARVQGGEPLEGSYWPAAARWELHPEAEAQREATEALLRTLDSRLADLESVHCALSGGLDSRVAAVALREIGKPARAFTHGLPDWPDVVEAARVAAHLGLAHEVSELGWSSDAGARALIAETALWSDGGAPSPGFAIPGRPRGLLASVTGNGGEVGRARSYRWLAANHRNPSPRDLTSVLGHLHQRIPGAGTEVRGELDRRLRRGVEEVQEQTGLRGWRTLDALHESRSRRFVRARLPRQDAYSVSAFSAVDVIRALASLPLRSRIADGFHRGFIAERAPALLPPEQQRAYRPFVPPPVRRLRHRLRSRQPPRPRRWFMAERWAAFPETRRWIEEAVLADPELRHGLGEGWSSAIAAGFAEDESHATETALRLASLVALRDEAMRTSRAAAET